VPWRAGADHWGGVAITLHWLSALAVFGLFALGLWMTGLSYYDRWYHDAPFIHRSIGVLLFIATLLRLAWRELGGRPVEQPGHAPWERVAAKLTHVALYLLLLGVMVSGYFISTADGRPVEVFGWFALPATLSGIDGQEEIAGAVHLSLAGALIALALLHAAAALKHHFFDRDRTLLQMLGL
jgi:cytochrome b561